MNHATSYPPMPVLSGDTWTSLEVIPAATEEEKRLSHDARLDLAIQKRDAAFFLTPAAITLATRLDLAIQTAWAQDAANAYVPSEAMMLPVCGQALTGRRRAIRALSALYPKKCLRPDADGTDMHLTVPLVHAAIGFDGSMDSLLRSVHRSLEGAIGAPLAPMEKRHPEYAVLDALNQYSVGAVILDMSAFGADPESTQAIRDFLLLLPRFTHASAVPIVTKEQLLMLSFENPYAPGIRFPASTPVSFDEPLSKSDGKLFLQKLWQCLLVQKAPELTPEWLGLLLSRDFQPLGLMTAAVYQMQTEALMKHEESFDLSRLQAVMKSLISVPYLEPKENMGDTDEYGDEDEEKPKSRGKRSRKAKRT